MKSFTPWQKLQFWLVVMIPLLFMLCFFSEFFRYPLPDSLKGIFMALWSVLLVLTDPKEIMAIIHQSYEKKEETPE